MPVRALSFTLEVESLEGQAPDDSLALRCDYGGPELGPLGGAPSEPAASVFSTVAVTVAIGTDDASRPFLLRPANACGASPRCGYVRIEGLDDSDAVVAQVETATLEGVLKLDLDRLPTRLRVSLISGVDQTVLRNADASKVVAMVTPTFVPPTDCSAPAGAGGAPGIGGAPLGGAPGDPAMGGAPGPGGAPGLGGAPGAAGTPADAGASP